MSLRQAISWALVGVLCAGPIAAAPKRKPAAKKPAAVAVVVVAPLPITCGAPLVAPKPEKKGLSDKLKGAAKATPKPPRLPEACVLARFTDPAFPLADATNPGQPAMALLGGGGPMPAVWPASTAELQKLVDEIAAAGPRPDVKARVLLVAERMEDARALFLSPGGADGAIVVTTGLLEHLYDQSKKGPEVQEHLRFFLAREYAHLVLKQPQKLDTGKGTYDQMAQALQMASLGISVVQGGEKARASGDLILAAGFIADLEGGEPARYRFPDFDRALEHDADLLAADILVRKGADPRTGVKGLRWVWDDNRGNIAANAALREQAGKASANAAQDIASLAQLKNAPVIMQKAQLMAASYVAGFAAKKLEERRQMAAVHLHDDADDRALLVADYLDAFYPDPTAAVAQTEAGRRPLPTLDFTRARPEIEGHRAAQRAETALAMGDAGMARAEIDAALTSPVGGNIDVQQLAAAVAIGEGKPEAAIKVLKAIAATGYKAPLVYQKLAVAWRMLANDNSALGALADGEAALGDARPFLLDRVAIHRARNDEQGLAAALRDCNATQDAMLIVACQRAGGLDVSDDKGTTVAGATGKLGRMVGVASSALGTQNRAAMARLDQPLPPAAAPPPTPVPAKPVKKKP